MNQPTKEEIRNLVKDPIFKWYLGRLNNYIDEIDTVRNIVSSDEYVARQLAIEIIENSVKDLVDAGELRNIGKEEKAVIKTLQNQPSYE